jgi:dynein heavy chain
MDQGTTLAELLALNLHECEDDVKTIVDKAVKEMSMEKMLRELQTTWAAMEFYQETHNRTGCSLLRASEKLIETLEENQVSQFAMLNGRWFSFKLILTK